MKEYKTKVTMFTDATISSNSIASIIEKEIFKLLGRQDRFIRDGFIRETDYRYNDSEIVRKATEEEIELYEALRKVYDYFKGF